MQPSSPPPPRRLPRPASLHRDAGAAAAAPPNPGLPRPSSFRDQPVASGNPPAPLLRRGSTFANRSANRPDSFPSSSSTSSLPPEHLADRPRLRRGPSFAAGLPDPSAFDTPPLPRLRRGSSFAGQPPRLSKSPSAFSPSSSSSSAASAAGKAPPPSAHGYVAPLERTTSIDTAAIADARRLSASKPGAPPPPGTFLRRSKNHATHANLRAPAPAPASPGPAHGKQNRLSASSGALPRAGTYAYGADAPVSVAPLTQPKHDRVVSQAVRRASSADRVAREKRVCGMCGNCNGVGPKGMPPWAPERLKLMSATEREAVLDELAAKEEVGKLEAELRKKRVADMRAVGKRLEHRRSSTLGLADDDPGAARANRRDAAAHDVPVVEMEGEPAGSAGGRAWKPEPGDGDAHSGDDDGDGAGRAKSARRRRARAGGGGGGGGGGAAPEDFGEDRTVMEREVKNLDEDCGLCDGLETKVGDLEEQLAMLKEVVKLCADNEEAARKLDGDNQDGKGAKKNKTWMDKISNAYFGNPAAAVERNRLKEEVDVLKKASDFLFEKLQTTGSSDTK